MKAMRHLAGMTGFAVLGVVAVPVHAQDAASVSAGPESENSAAGDIIVTARRTEERLQDVPISIAVFNQAQLTNRNISSAVDLAVYTPSLSSNNRFGAESASFSIRGFTQEGQTSPSVAVYFADVVAPRAQGGTTAGNGAGVGSFFDLQNVQVLRGPQGTLFGRNTTGGAILLVPQKPTSNLEGYVEGSIGNYDLKRIQAVVNVPLTDTFKVRLGVDRQERDGYLHNISGIGPRDFADIDYTAARLSIVADLTPELENYTIATYSDSDTNGFYPKILFQDQSARDPFPVLHAAQIAATSGNFYDVANGDPTARQHIRQWGVINTTTWRASDTLTVKNIASYTEFRQAQSLNIYGENGYQNGANPPYTALMLIPAPGFDNVAQSTFTEEFQLLGNLGDRLKYQAGIYYEQSDPLGFQRTFSANGLACTNLAALQCADLTGRGFVQSSATKYRFRDLGLYAQATYKLTDTLGLTAGIRYTNDRTRGLGEGVKYFFARGVVPGGPIGYGCVQPSLQVIGGTSAQVQADPTRCDFRRTAKSSKPTWLLDVDWHPNGDILLYGKYARGYRQGGVNVSSYGLETWNPEKVDLYEIGIKTSFHGAVSGNLNVSAFYNDFSNQQIAINVVSCQLNPASPLCAGIPPSGYPASGQGIGNSGKSTIKGVEVDGAIRPFEGLQLSGSYAYLDTKLKSIALPPTPTGFFLLAPAAVLGGPLSITPKNKYSITAAYTLPLPDEYGELSVSATYSHQDKSFGTTSSVPLRQTLPGYHTVNLNLNWNSVAKLPVDVALFATNVTKERFVTYYTGSSFGWEAAALNEPRMYGLRLKYHFAR